jgi:mono/diheme cytochrome c family protein
MSMHERDVVPAGRFVAGVAPAVVVLAQLIASSAVAQELPALGVEATPDEIAGWALSIMPDGSGLPPGSGTPADGAVVFHQKCMACHGAEGQGGPNDQLVGGHGTIAGPAPVKTVGSYWPYATTIFDYVRRAMPFTAPQSLSDDEVYAVTAYLLSLNGIIDDDTVIDAKTLPEVEMPNGGNFFRAYEE